MLKKYFVAALWVLFSTGASMSPAWGHVTPSIKLHTTREVIQQLLPEGKLFIKEVTLNSEQKARLNAFDNWDTRNDHFKFYISRGEDNRLNRVMMSMIEFTRHGPMVMAVAIDANGQVQEALLTDIQMETLTWVDPILKSTYIQELRGKDSSMPLTLEPKWKKRFTSISQGFALSMANAVKKSAQLFQVAFRNRPESH